MGEAGPSSPVTPELTEAYGRGKSQNFQKLRAYLPNWPLLAKNLGLEGAPGGP